ncbi:MAG TPA: DUF1134 domain-containing protein [Solimonas sp.]
MSRLWLPLLAVFFLASCATSPSDDTAPPRSILSEEGGAAPSTPSEPAARSDQTYSSEEIAREASKFFGESSENVARAVERVFSDYGRPVGYIYGNEGGGALIVGVRFGEGTLQYKGGGSMKVFWQGPSIGFDYGGNASKVFTLVYNLEDTSMLFQRYPAVEGSLYVVAGMSVNYQRSGNIVLAPIRTGVGLRAGANLGYVHYTRERSFVPL